MYTGGASSEFVWRTLAELGKWSGGKTPSMAERSYWEDGTIPWISSKDMKSSTLSDTEDHITDKAVQGISMTIYQQGHRCQPGAAQQEGSD